MEKFRTFILMYVSFFIYSLSGILIKIASQTVFLSSKYTLCFIGVFFILAIYSVLWQQVLKRIELSVAMSNKPIVLILATIWAVLFFGEQITIKFIIGLVMIFVGIFVIGVRNE